MNSEGAAQLPSHQGRLSSDNDARESQHDRSVENDLVLPQLIIEPTPRSEMNGAVDLDGHASPIRERPFRVKVATAARRFDAHRLSRRFG